MNIDIIINMVPPALRNLAFTTAIFILSSSLGVSSFPGGSPYSTCLTLYPLHRNQPSQTSPSPFHIHLQPSSGNENTLKVTLSAEPDYQGQGFSGFQMAAFRESCPQEIVGTFDGPLPDKAKAFSCVGGVKNMVTHKNGNHVKSITFDWTAPQDDVGNVTFRATVLTHFGTYWTDVTKTLITNATGSSTCDYPAVPIGNLTKSADFSGCGSTKACFLYPLQCKGSDCVAAVSFQYRNVTDDYQVEMYADPGPSPDYVGVAFSADDEMGSDETFVCTAKDLVMSVQHGYNPGKENELLRSSNVTDATVKHEDGRLECQFVMQPKSTIRHIKQSTATSDSPQTQTIDFDKTIAWRIQLAWGPVIADSDVISMHKDMPPTTSSKMMIKEAGIYRGTAYPTLVKVHVGLMLVAWTFLSGILTVIARHYRDMLPRTRLLGTQVWFQLHRGLAILVAILTGIGIIVIFTGRGFIKRASVPHAVCGLVVVLLLGLQIIIAIRRPGFDHKRRAFFNLGHRLLGQVTHLFAAITMFLAFKIDSVTETMRNFGLTTLGIWLAVQVLWHIGFEVLGYILQRSDSDCELLDNLEEIDNTWVEAVTKVLTSSKSHSVCSAGRPWIPVALMVTYAVFLLGCCISVLYVFLLY